MHEKNLFKLVGLAINDYHMIKEDDRIVIGISGGMDSLALLLILQKRMRYLPIQYELFPVFVDNFNGENEEHNARIKTLSEFVRMETGLNLKTLPIPTVQNLTSGSTKSRDTCYLCAQKRRDTLMKYAFENKCCRLALGHHKDDIVETTLMNLFYQRELSAMLPRLDLFDGKLDLIRPLAYISKEQIEDYIYNRELPAPVFGEVCPSRMNKRDLRRNKVRKTMESLSKEIPNLKNNIFAAFRNPKFDYFLDHLYQPESKKLSKRP